MFLALNSEIVQRQIRSIQFTADTIDTIGNRYLEITLPIPKEKKKCNGLVKAIKRHLDERERGKAFIKGCPTLIEEVIATNNTSVFSDFLSKDWDDLIAELKQETVTSEFGHFETFWQPSNKIKDRIFLPKYYDPEIIEELRLLETNCECVTIGELQEAGIVECKTGDEIGKMAYGTGTIPFIRTSDFANWEIKHDPKQGVSEEIYREYADSEDVKPLDILLVRDGTYLVGSSCIITENDSKILYCGGLYKIRVKDEAKMNPWLLLGLLNSYIVKRQLRTKQFTRDVIDTIGKRLFEIVLPIPKSSAVVEEITERLKAVVEARISARVGIKQLSGKMMES